MKFYCQFEIYFFHKLSRVNFHLVLQEKVSGIKTNKEEIKLFFTPTRLITIFFFYKINDWENPHKLHHLFLYQQKNTLYFRINQNLYYNTPPPILVEFRCIGTRSFRYNRKPFFWKTSMERKWAPDIKKTMKEHDS